MRQTITPLTKNCKFCNKTYFKKVNISFKNWIISKYCSIKCKNKDLIGKPTWNKGIKADRTKYPTMGHFEKHTKEALLKITKANRINAKLKPKSFFQENQKKAIIVGKLRGSYKGTLGKKKELSYVWLGENATYNSKHKWIQKNWQKMGICEKCGEQPQSYGNRKFGTEWHSLNEKYNREKRNMWLEVCKKCHRELDEFRSKQKIRLRGTI